MNFIVLGAAGFIGSNLCEKLLSMGHKVVGIDNLEYGNLNNIKKIKNHSSFVFHHKDIIKSNILDKVHGEVLVHLASQKIPRYDNSLRTLSDNDIMTNLVIKKCIQEDTKLVFASTSDVYGKNPSIPFTEKHDLVLGPTKIKRWAYATSKIFSEHKIIANHEANKLNYTIVRFFGSYGINQNLTFSHEDRSENIRRIAEISKLFIDSGCVVIGAFISPYQKDRALVKTIVNEENFIEVYVNTSIEECERRDIKGLYKKARKGEIKNFTGISAPYEIPENPNIEIKTEQESVEDATIKIANYIKNKLRYNE